MKLFNLLTKSKPLKTLVLVRHGNDSGQDRSLNKTGLEQAKKISDQLKDENFDHIYTSDLERAYQTYQIIQKKQNNPNCSIIDNIREISPYHSILNLGPITLEKKVTETIKNEVFKINQFIAHINNTYKNGERILIICHGHVIRYLLSLPRFTEQADSSPKISAKELYKKGALKCSSDAIVINNTSITTLEVDSDLNINILDVNNTSHLTKDLIT